MKLSSEKIKKIEKIPYNGFLYNLTTTTGNLFANKILVKNSGGLGTPPHERLVVGMIHRANDGVLFCYAPDTNVFLNNGKPTTIEELWNEFSDTERGVIDTSKQNLQLLSQSVTGIIKPIKCLKISKINAPELLIKIKSKSNEEIILTPNHPLEVFRNNKTELVAASELSPDDLLIKAINFSNIEKNDTPKVTNFQSKQKDATKISIPDIDTYDFGRFLGLIASDGRVTEKGVIFYNQEENLIQTVQHMYSSMFNIPSCDWFFINKHINNKKINVSAAHSVELLNYLKCLNIDSNIKQYPPDILFNLSRETQRGFLQGYCEGDGSANSTSEIRYANKNLKFIIRMKSLLLISNIKSTHIKDRAGYCLSITGKNNISKLSILKTKPSLKKLVDTNGYETNRIHGLAPTLKFIRNNLSIPIDQMPVEKGYYLDIQENRRAVGQNQLKKIVYTFSSKIKMFRQTVENLEKINDFIGLKTLINKLNLEHIDFNNNIHYKDLNYFFNKKKKYGPKTIAILKDAIIKILTIKIKKVQSALKTLEFFTHDVITDRIKSIEIIQNKNIKYVYNLYLETDHTPVTNFLITHNCDEIANLKIESQQELLTAMQEKKYPITGQSERSSGAMVRSEAVPCDFILVAAGNLETVKHMHPALRSRIRGYGYEVYMNDTMDDTLENCNKLYQFIAQEVQKDKKIPHFSKAAGDLIIQEARRRAGIANKLTLRLRDLGGLIRTAGDLALEQKSNLVEPKHILEAKKLARSLEQQIADKYIENRKKYEVILTTGTTIGRVNGLAVIGTEASFSGIVLPIESEVALGGKKTEFVATGQLGKIAKEAVKNVSAIILKYFGEDIKERYDIFIQFIGTPEGVEGDSASIAVATSIISALKKVPVRQDTAMTGSLSIRGEVLAVGGVSAKIEAAIDAGIKRVIIPKTNEKDIVLSAEKLSKIKIITAENITNVLEESLEWKGKQEILDKIKSFK